MVGSLAAAGGLLVWACNGDGDAASTVVQTATVQRGTIRVSVNATGTTQYVNQNNLTFGSPGTVESVTVRQGDKVTKDQVLAKLQGSDLQQAVDQANAALLNAQDAYDTTLKSNGPSDVAKAQQAVAAADVSIQNAQNALALSKSGISQALSIHNQEQTVAELQGKLSAAQTALLAAKDGSQRQSDLAALQQTLSNARVTLDTAESDLAKAREGLGAGSVATAQANLDASHQTLAIAQAQLPNTQTVQDRLVSDALRALQEKQTAQQALLSRAFGIGVSLEETLLDPVLLIARHPPQFYAAASAEANAGWLAATRASNDYNTALTARDSAVAAARKAVTTAQDAITSAQDALTTAQSNAVGAGLTAKQAKVDVAKAALAIAQLNLNSLMDTPLAVDIAAKQAAANQASSNVDAAKSTLEQLRATPLSVDVAVKQTALDVAKAALVDAQESLKKVQAGPDPAQVASKKAALQAAQATLKTAQDNQTRATMKAPYDGILSAVNIKTGDTIGAGTVAIIVVDPTRLLVQATVDEADILRVRVGLPVLVTLSSAAPGVQIPGVVMAVVPTPRSSQGIVSYPVDVELTLAPGQGATGARLQGQTGQGQSGAGQAGQGTQGGARGTLGQGQATAGANAAAIAAARAAQAQAIQQVFGGLSATVSIIVQEAADILTVPTRAVNRTQGQSTVNVLKADGAKEVRQVTTGVSDGTSIAITTGLEEGERVVLPTSAARTTTTTQGGGAFGGGPGPGGFVLPR